MARTAMLLLKSVCTKPKTALPKRSASGGEGEDRRSGCEADETAYSPNILTKSSEAIRNASVSTPSSVIETSAKDFGRNLEMSALNVLEANQ